MLSQVECRTDTGAMLNLPLYDGSQGYIVKEIEGLDPVEATIVSSGFANLDGEQYQSSKRGNRNINIKMGYTKGMVVSSLRQRLYEFFMPKTAVHFRFMLNDGLVLEISGIVESFTAPLFAKDPEINISIICHLPDFYERVPEILSGLTVADQSTFIESYIGSIETGFIFRLNVNRTLAGFEISNIIGDNSSRLFEFDAPLLPGDVVTVSTVSGSKSAMRMRDGIEKSVLYGVSPYSDWVNLYPGQNHLRVHATGVPVPFTLEYTKKYGGL